MYCVRGQLINHEEELVISIINHYIMHTKKILRFSSIFHKIAVDDFVKPEDELLKYNVMQLFREDGTPYTRDIDMMEGSLLPHSMDPIVELVTKPVIIPTRQVGDIFMVDAGGGTVKRWFQVKSKTKAIELPIRISSKMQALQQKIEREFWIGGEYVEELKKELDNLIKSVASQS